MKPFLSDLLAAGITFGASTALAVPEGPKPPKPPKPKKPAPPK